jgi:hypothetical protein
MAAGLLLLSTPGKHDASCDAFVGRGLEKIKVSNNQNQKVIKITFIVHESWLICSQSCCASQKHSTVKPLTPELKSGW